MYQSEGESVAQYHVRLRLQEAKCGFTDPDDVIRRKILQTIRDKELRREAMKKRYALQQFMLKKGHFARMCNGKKNQKETPKKPQSTAKYVQ